MINPASITEEMKDAYYAVKQYYYQEDVKALLSDDDHFERDGIDDDKLIDTAVDILMRNYQSDSGTYWDNIEVAISTAIIYIREGIVPHGIAV